MNDQELKIKNFSQTWPKPTENNPIVIIGTGGIGGLLAILLSNNRNEVYCSNKKGDFGKFQLKLKKY